MANKKISELPDYVGPVNPTGEIPISVAGVTYKIDPDELVDLSVKVDKVPGKGLSTEDYTTAEKDKLAGIAAGAEVNVNADWSATSGDAQILNKPSIPSISGLATETYVDAKIEDTIVDGVNTKAPSQNAVFDALATKVDKVTGKGLSTEDYTSAEKTKLSGIEAGAEVNVNADWNATSGDAQILNKPSIPSITGLATENYVDAKIENQIVDGVIDKAPSQNAVNLALDTKVDKVSGKQLSANDFTDALKNKLNGIEAGAEVNVNADWNATSGDAEILNKPAIEPPIAAGTTAQYWRGDKTWQTLDKTAVGLSNVDNTSDTNKPISTATQTALNLKADLVGGLIPSSQLPSFVDDVLEFANAAARPTTGETGKIYVTLDDNKIFRWSGSTYIEISPSPGSTDSVAEGSTNLYFTNARARAAVSFTPGSGAYDLSTGVFTIPTNTNQLTNGAGFITGVAWGDVASRPTALSQFSNDLGNYGGWITASSSNTLTNKSGNISQWTNDSGYITGVSWTSVSGRPTNLSQFTNDLGNYGGWITASSSDTLTNKSGNISQWTNNSGYITGINSSMVTTALGYTPYNNTNPSGFITSSSLTWSNISGKPSFATVATSGDYNDLINKPSAIGQVNSDWNATSGVAQILNKPTALSQFSNDSGFITSSSLTWTNISSRPTALSQFTNDLGNYGGWITGYTETDTLQSVTDRGASTTNNITAPAFFQTSDERLKNILDRDGDVIYFKWIDLRDDKVHIGYVAQEVKNILPEQVNEDEDGILSVNYTEVLVDKVRKLENIVEHLMSRIDELERISK